MSGIKLTDIKWMEPDLAARLAQEGVTVEDMASTPPDEFLKRHPYVGSINAWLLTSEAKYLLNMAGAGLWESGQEEHERTMQALEELEAEQRRVRPEMRWPPPPPEPQQYSARVRRIRASQGLTDED